MMANSRNTIKEALIKAIRERAKTAFQASKPRTPVKTGYLKNSAINEDLPNGSRLFWKALYASFIEHGCRAMWVQVRAYWHTSGYFVKAHRRWQPARAPVEFIKKSMKESFEGFALSFDRELRSNFDNVIRR